MSNMTQLDNLLQKIVDLENEIIEKNKIINKSQEEMDSLQDTYKNFVMNFDALINGEKNGN